MMRRTVIGLSLVVALAITSSVSAQQVKVEKKSDDVLCPVMGEKINKTIFVDSEMGRAYFCCEKCVKRFKSGPQKYAKKVFAQQDAMGVKRVQVSCPLTGEPVDPKVSVKHDGMTVNFCCERCAAGFKKNPEKHMPAYYKSFTTQTECPVMGEEIDPTASVKLANDEKVYLCCKRCVTKFGADRAKYGKRLAVFYMCTMEQCKDPGSVTGGDCAKCGMHRKQIGRQAKASGGDHGHEGGEHGEHKGGEKGHGG